MNITLTIYQLDLMKLHVQCNSTHVSKSRQKVNWPFIYAIQNIKVISSLLYYTASHYHAELGQPECSPDVMRTIM